MNLQLYLLVAIPLAFVLYAIVYTKVTGKPFIVIDTGAKRDGSSAPQTGEAVEPVTLAALQGAWRMISVGRNGNFAPASAISQANVVMNIEGQQFHLPGSGSAGRFELGEPAVPTLMDQHDNDGDTHLCIARFIGGELEICQGEAGSTRPTTFDRKRRDGASLTRFKRL